MSNNSGRRNRCWVDQRGRCYYCTEDVPRDAATLEHLTPVSLGGTNHPANLVMACEPCNHTRGANLSRGLNGQRKLREPTKRLVKRFNNAPKSYDRRELPARKVRALSKAPLAEIARMSDEVRAIVPGWWEQQA